jgi:hypothetical protein
MIKRYLFLLLSVPTLLFAQQSFYDTTAISLLNRMGSVIGDMRSCEFALNTSNDVIDMELGLVKYFTLNRVYLVGPDKMLVDSHGEKGHRGLWYNGEKLVFYSYSENNYAVIDAPPTIISTIDTVNKNYGIDFPAADFFYPTFTLDLIDNNDEIILAGKSRINDKECFHIIAKNDYMSTQIWISDDALCLPVKMVVVDYSEMPNAQYEATFSNWKINSDYPDAMFDFTPPPNANKVRLLAK